MEPSLGSFGIQGLEPDKVPGSPHNDIHPVPGRTPRLEDHGGSGFPGTPYHLKGTCQDHLKSLLPPSGDNPATQWVVRSFGS
jgi:hypothetical protein